MWALFDDSPGTIFASAAGLIVYFELLSAIPVVWAISEKDDKHSSFFVLAFPRGGWKDVRVATEHSFATIFSLCTSDNYL